MVWATRLTSPSFSCQWWSKENHPLVRPGLGRVPFERCLLLMLVLRVTMVMMIVIADTSQPLIWTVFLLSRYMSYFPSMPALMFRTSSLQHLRFLRNRPELQKIHCMPGLFPRSSIDYFPPGLTHQELDSNFRQIPHHQHPRTQQNLLECLWKWCDLQNISIQGYEGKSSMFGCNHLASEVPSKNRRELPRLFWGELLGIGDLPGLRQHQSFQDYANERWRVAPKKERCMGVDW